MAFLINFGFTQFGNRSARLFGDGPEIRLVQLGVVQIIWFRHPETTWKFKAFLDSGLNLPEFIVENSAVLGQYKIQTRREIEAEFESRIESLENNLSKYHDQIRQLSYEKHQTEEALKIVLKMRETDSPDL